MRKRNVRRHHGRAIRSKGQQVTTQFDEARLKIHTQLQSLRREMAAVHRDFLTATSAFSEQWYQSQAQRILSQNPGRFAELLPSKRSALKSAVMSLVDESSRLIEQFFGEADLWWDQKDPAAPRRHYCYDMRGDLLPESIDEPLRFVLGALLPVMEEAGFSVMGFSYKCFGKAYAGQPQRFPFFRQRYRTSAQMVQSLEKYATLHGATVAAEHQLVDLDREEARSQDQLLWDMA